VKFLEFRKQVEKFWPEIEKKRTPKVTPAAGLNWKLAA